MNGKIKLVAVFLVFLDLAVFGQQNGTVPQVPAAGQTAGPTPLDVQTPAAERLSLAVSSLEYPVTHGDLYRLSYRQSAGTVLSIDVLVDSARILDLGVFGKIDGSGQTFVQVKQKAEALIAKNYAFSLPNLSIVSPGIFRVAVREGASLTRYATAWGLSRLSEIVSGFSGSSVSRRNVELVPAGGRSASYDLLQAAVANDSTQDPFVKPGDTIILHAPGRTVHLIGEVRRPGSYELRGEEGLETLIEFFGGGLSSQADAQRIRIDRTGDRVESSDYVSIPSAYRTKYNPSDGDTVLVRSRSDYLPIVWFEGAVSGQTLETATGSGLASTAGGVAGAPAATGAGVGDDASLQSDTRGRFSWPIREGQLMSDIVQDIRTGFLPLADLASASIYMPGQSLPAAVDLQSLLAGTDLSTDVPLYAGYRIVVPAIRTTVMVSGAVYSPGPVPYKPNAPAGYYLILAGGVDPWRNSYKSCIVYDQNGNRRKESEGVQPGDQIHVRENSVGYALERRTPVVASIVGLAVTILTFFAIAQ